MQQPFLGFAAFYPHTAPFYEQRVPAVRRTKLLKQAVVKRRRKKK